MVVTIFFKFAISYVLVFAVILVKSWQRKLTQDSETSVDSLSWSESGRSILQEAAACTATPSEPSTSDQGAVQSPAGPINVRSALQDLDIIHVACTARPGQADHIVDMLVSTFRTDLTRNGVLSMVLLLLGLRRDLGNFVRERILQGHPPACLLQRFSLRSLS